METIESLALTFLLNALWQVPLLAATAAAGGRLLRRAPARHRFTVWLTAFLLCTLLPLSSLLPARRRAEASPVVNIAQPPHEAAPDSGRVASLRGPPSILSAGSADGGPDLRLWRHGPLAGGPPGPRLPAHRAHRPQRTSTGAPRGLLRDRRALPYRFQIICRTPAPLGEGDKPGDPRRPAPAILLPPSFVTDASEAQLTAALGHEMAHIRRRDYAVHLLCEALFSRSPFIRQRAG